MSAINPTAARSYAAGVQALFVPAPSASTERGTMDGVPANMAEQAEQLAPMSGLLTTDLAAGLSAPGDDERIDASTQLLAKALVDLEVSAMLLQAAEDEQAGIAPTIGAVERSGGGLGTRLEQSLKILRGEVDDVAVVERSGWTARDPVSARLQLADTAADLLLLIRERAASSGLDTVGRLLGLGAGPLTQAAGVVGLDIAAALGQAEAVSKLYSMAREFAFNAYNALLALLGPGIAKAAARQMAEWIEGLSGDKQLFGKLLERLYDTTTTTEAVRRYVERSTVELDAYAAADAAVRALTARHARQMKLAGWLGKGLGGIAALPVAAIPQALLLLGAGHIVLGSYIVLSGADFVDAPGLDRLNRTAGVRRIVESSLAGNE